MFASLIAFIIDYNLSQNIDVPIRQARPKWVNTRCSELGKQFKLAWSYPPIGNLMAGNFIAKLDEISMFAEIPDGDRRGAF